MKENINIISGAFAFVGTAVIALFDNIKGEFVELIGFIGIFFIIFFFVKSILRRFIQTDAGKNIENNIQRKKNLIVVKQNVKKELLKYQNAKNSFRYFSSEKLMSLYHDYKKDKIENMERLALEETMVEKGLLGYSEMHEKLHIIKKRFDID